MLSKATILVLHLAALINRLSSLVLGPASQPASQPAMKSFSADKSALPDADVDESEMLDSISLRSTLNRRYQRLRQRFILICVLCGIFFLVSLIMVGESASKKSKSKSDDSDNATLPNASYCQAFMMNAVRVNSGDRCGYHGVHIHTNDMYIYTLGR